MPSDRRSLSDMQIARHVQFGVNIKMRLGACRADTKSLANALKALHHPLRLEKGLSDDQFRERLDKLRELRILPEHRTDTDRGSKFIVGAFLRWSFSCTR
jgi:hypothetical protein